MKSWYRNPTRRGSDRVLCSTGVCEVLASFCLLLTAYCLLLTAFCLLVVRSLARAKRENSRDRRIAKSHQA